MKLKREPDNVDLFVIDDPMSIAEKKEFSLFLQNYKKKKVNAKKRKPLTKKAIKR
ncbi:MAG TPA: hypothetical protein VK809_06425 [Bacteroidia bacterium]|jgi:hypothetical protein|nr:hypothetical protein [Bacteroidia bacterium]